MSEAEKAQAGLDSMRNQFRDGQITMLDCASITEAAKRFGVPYFSAYLRAKELGLLSYQTPIHDALAEAKLIPAHGRSPFGMSGYRSCQLFWPAYSQAPPPST